MRRERVIPAEAAAAVPVDAEEFATLMQRFAPLPRPLRLALAVSGGPDSMALALCARRWMDGNSPQKPAALVALIVDHALRPGSAQEAADTRDRLAGMGMGSEILRWEHGPVTGRLHPEARKARYALLAQACARLGIRHLMLAHQRDDQAETILMRLAKGSGTDGLAGIAAISERDGLTLWRPFLTTPRARLAATCEAAGLPYVRDPSNESEAFARGRLRRIMPLLAREGLTVERLCELGARARADKDALDSATSAFLALTGRRDETGVVRIDRTALREAPTAIAIRALARAIRSVHMGDYPPGHKALTRLHDALRREPPPLPSTLHGCLICATPRDVIIMREFAAITDSQTVGDKHSVLWDGRWRVSCAELPNGNPCVVKALGHPPHATLDRLSPRLRHLVPQGRARSALPALWQGKEIILIPSLTDAQGHMRATLLPFPGIPNRPWRVKESLA